MLRTVPFSNGTHVSKPEKPTNGEETLSLSMRDVTRPPGEGTPEQINGFVRFFRHFGCHLEEWISSTGLKQLRGQCPFPLCHKDDHFFMNPSNGLWDCKKCQLSGNTYTFIRQLHAAYLALTGDLEYKSLCELRQGISSEAFRYHKLAYNSRLQEWMAPTFNKDNEVVNLHMWRKSYNKDDGSEYMGMISSPTIKPVLLGMEHFRKEDRKSPLHIWEGHWDYYAAWTVMRKMNMLETNQLLGMPGAGVFPREFLNLLVGRDCRFCLDNDEAGRNGTTRIITDMANHAILPTAVYAMKWPDVLPDGFDNRDVVLKYNSRSRAAPFDQYSSPMQFITKHMVRRKIEIAKSDNEGYDPDVSPMHCSSFKNLVDCCAEKLHVDEGFVDSLAYALTLNVAVSMGGNMLWGHLIGPPSSGKTTIAEIVGAAHPYTYSTSKITGMFSGWGGTKKGGDPGMVPKFQGKLAMIKDLTTVLAGTGQEMARVFGDLRDIYDGAGGADYRNGRSQHYDNVRFGLMTCVTDIIRTLHHSTLGERFLCCEIDSKWTDKGKLIRLDNGTTDRMRYAGDNTLDSLFGGSGRPKLMIPKQKSMCWGLLDHIHTQINEDVDYTKRLVHNIRSDNALNALLENMANWVAMSRSRVDRDNAKDISYRPRIELGPRLYTQLLKTTVGLCMVYQTDYVDTEIWNTVRKVALDTAVGFPLEIMLHLAASQKDGMTKETISNEVSMSLTGANKWLEDMRELNIVTMATTQVLRHNSATTMIRRVGRPSNVYRLTPEAKSLATNLGFC